MDSKYVHVSAFADSAPRRPKIMTPADLIAPVPPEPVLPYTASAAAGAAAAAAAAAGVTAAGAAEGDIVHVVGPRDTILGLSMKYRVSVRDIMMANDLPTENIHTCRTLRIPRPLAAPGLSPQPRSTSPGGARRAHEAALVRRFMSEHDACDIEARMALEEAGWEYDTAHRRFGAWPQPAAPVRSAPSAPVLEVHASSRAHDLSDDGSMKHDAEAGVGTEEGDVLLLNPTAADARASGYATSASLRQRRQYHTEL